MFISRHRTAAATTDRIRPSRRLRTTLVGIIAALALPLSFTSIASADRSIAGVGFSSTVTCSTSVDQLEVMTGSSASSGSFAMIYLQNVRTGAWVHENPWHNVSGFPVLIHDAFNFTGHTTYRVWIQYAQATSSGWLYNGEYPSTYYQRNANGYGTHATSTCTI